MSVIIHDFEIIPERPASDSPDEDEAAAAPPALRPIDVIEIVRQHERRTHRLRAH